MLIDAVKKKGNKNNNNLKNIKGKKKEKERESSAWRGKTKEQGASMLIDAV